jgi:hypothetical protein
MESFLERFNNFKDAEFRSIEISSATIMKVTFATQDAARAFDWLTIELEFSGVSDAKLLNEDKLSLVDMSDGISLMTKDNIISFAIGYYTTQKTIKDSICYILSSSVKYQEGSF